MGSPALHLRHLYLFFILLHNQARNISWSSDTVAPNSRISVPDKRGVSVEKIR